MTHHPPVAASRVSLKNEYTLLTKITAAENEVAPGFYRVYNAKAMFFRCCFTQFMFSRHNHDNYNSHNHDNYNSHNHGNYNSHNHGNYNSNYIIMVITTVIIMVITTVIIMVITTVNM